MASLYQINEEIASIFAKYDVGKDTTVDMETGEVVSNEDVLAALNQLTVDREKKLDNYAFIIKDNKVTIEGVATEIKRLQKLKSSLENTNDFLISVLATEYKGKNYKDSLGRYAVSFRKTKSVDLLDESKVPSIYKTPQPDKISKAEILKALKSGEEVPGAAMIEKVSCSVK